MGERHSMIDKFGAVFTKHDAVQSSDWTMIEKNRSIFLSQQMHNDQMKKPSIFRSNRIRTSKYTWLTFLPLNLYSQY